MSRVHAANDNDIPVIDTHVIQTTEHTSISSGRVGKGNSKSSTKTLEIDRRNLSMNENTAKSNNEEGKSSCNNLQTKQKQTKKKTTLVGENIIRSVDNFPNSETVQTIEEEDEVHPALELEKEQHEWR